MSNLLYDTLFAPYAGKSTPFLHLPDGEVISHGAFVERAAQYAHALCDMGLAPGERVAVQVEKSHEALALYAGCVQAGLIYLPLNTAYTAQELEYFIENSGASLVVCDGARSDALAPMAQGLNARLHTLNGDGSGSLSALADQMAGPFPTVARAADDLAAFLYTSGTTGRSKGAMLTHKNLLSNAQVLVKEWHFEASDVLLHALPIFHTHGLFVASHVVLLCGGSMVFFPKFDANTMLERMPRATTMMGVPTFYTRLLAEPGFDRDVCAKMRLFISGSAPLLAQTHEDFEARTGHRILERYGMTETNMNTSNPYCGERRAGTVGFALPGVELKITDPDTGEEVAPGDIGVIEVRGENVFQGYWQMPEKTAAELREDGFFITGDLARVDRDGYVQIVGRSKDLIISGGYNIYPKEIEQVLDRQPGVLESAVIGVPHSDFGETVLAVMVAQPGETLEVGPLEAAVGEALARFKHPRKYVFVENLPRNTMGKVQKNALREQFSDATS